MSKVDTAILGTDSGSYAVCASLVKGFSDAWIIPSESKDEFNEDYKVLVKRSFRDVDNDKNRSILQTFNFNGTEFTNSSGFPIEVTGAIRLSVSPSGNYMAIVKEDDKEKKTYKIEIWGPNSSFTTIACGTIHGKVLGDSWFGAFTWCKDESYAVYVAEKYSGGNDTEKDSEKELTNKKFEFKEDWGEKYDGVHSVDLCVVNIKTGRVAKVEGIPENITPGQPIFSPEGHRIIYTGWNNLPRRLGMIYCYQRPCSLFVINIESLINKLKYFDDDFNEDDPDDAGTPLCLTPKMALARSPRFGNTGTKLAFLGSEKGFDTHNGGVQLQIIEWDKLDFQNAEATIVKRVIVDTVDTVSKETDFPGLWLDSLPNCCFSRDDKWIFLTTAWRSKMRLVKISTDGYGPLSIDEARNAAFIGLDKSKLSQDAKKEIMDYSSVSLLKLDPQSGLLLVASSCPNSPGGFGMLIPTLGDNYTFVEGPVLDSTSVSSSRIMLHDKIKVKNSISDITWKVLQVQPSDGGATYEAILMLPPKSEDQQSLPPLLVTPHGGPHSCSTTAFVHSYAYLCAHFGFAILHVNYRGSTGFGCSSLKSLAGACGTQDVSDLLDATKQVSAINPQIIDSNRIGIVGGSHGGFLSGHMIGQYPDIYKVGALRNPVTNMASMVTVSDIPDWCYVEALGEGSYDFSSFRPPTAEELEVMWKASPVAHIKNVVAPTLVALGAKDRRVPWSQGLEYHNALRCAGVQTKLLVYPEDVHAIDKPASETDHWIHIGRWFRDYI